MTFDEALADSYCLGVVAGDIEVADSALGDGQLFCLLDVHLVVHVDAF